MTTNVLMYADDPGAANYLAPIEPALSAAGFSARMMVSPALESYVSERSMNASVRNEQTGPGELLAGADFLLVGTSEDPDCFGYRLTIAAREHGIPSIGAVDMAVNSANRFRGGSDDPLRFVPDFLVVPDEATRDAYDALGYPVERVTVCGHPHFDIVRERRRELERQNRQALRISLFPEAPAGRPVWVFLAEGVDRLDPAVTFRSPDYSLDGRGDSDFRSMVVLEEILDAAAGLSPQPWIVLRLHPKNELQDFTSVLDEIGMVSCDGDPLPLIWAADLTIGMTTMLLQEAYLLGVSHLSVLPRESERQWLGALITGLTPSFSRRDDLRAALSRDSSDFLPKIDRLPHGALDQVVAFVEGLAGAPGRERWPT